MSCVCQDTFEIKEGATSPGVIAQLLEYYEDNGDTKSRLATDIPEESEIRFKMHGMLNGVRSEIIPPTDAEWSDYENRLVTYDFQIGQTDLSGIFSGYIDVIYPDTGVETFGPFRINIMEL